MGPAGRQAEEHDATLKRRVLHWAQSWPVFVVMCGWLAVFAWLHLVPEDVRDRAREIEAPDARAAAGAPGIVKGAVVHRID